MIPVCVVDAFTTEPFGGNPAAVCRLPAPVLVSSQWMQSLAAEMNLSETAFVTPRPDGDWDLRWFTPKVEVNLCGHATLATAHALWESKAAPDSNSLRFHTRSGVLVCTRRGERIVMDFPARTPEAAPFPEALLPGLRLEAESVSWHGRDVDDVLVEVCDEATLRALQPDFATLRLVTARGVIVTAVSSRPEFDFVSRFFAPAAGIDEDPVTGSAHCALAVHWGTRLNRRELRGWQASARGGAVGVEWRQDRVNLLGQAVTVWRGELRIDPPAGESRC
jgi:PhzF family phenazine biosynthesis protein